MTRKIYNCENGCAVESTLQMIQVVGKALSYII